jgi:hypothetical protein
MNVKPASRAIAASTVLALSALAAHAQSLTPVGAEIGPNKDNSIPAFQGWEPPVPGWEYGKPRIQFWKHKAEKPLFVIDAANADKYAERLTPGQLHLLKTIKGYTMPVYQTHRTCSYPDFIHANTKANQGGKAKIGADGWSLEDAALPGVPFPAPKSGIEAMWNFLVRYSGVGVEYSGQRTYVSPAPGASAGITVGWNQLMYFPWAAKGTNSPKSEGDLQQGIYYAYQEPAALAGQAIVQRQYFNKDNESFYYFTGQRRVRRLPSYAYDAPLIGFENQYPVDMSFIFIGSPDRFDWKVVGKKELYVPYNNFALNDPTAKREEVLGAQFVAASHRRYELHRVWHIEGTVKDGVRHSAPKKTIYLDEDTWGALVGDDYDVQGKLWKHKEVGIMPYWEASTCTNHAQGTFYDFTSGRYVADPVLLDAKKDVRILTETSQHPGLKSNFFTAETLRANSER